MEEESKPIVQEAEVEEDKGSNNGGGSTTSYSSEEYVKVNQDDSIDDAAGDVPAEPVEDVGSVQAPKPTETGIGEILMSKIDPRADFDGENQEEPAIATAERSTPQSQSEFPKEEPAENNPGLIDGISQGGHHSFEPAPASSFLPEPTPVETERVNESASNNDDTEITSEDDGVVSEKDLTCGASLKGVDTPDEVNEAAQVPSVGGIQDVEDKDACMGELFAPILGAGLEQGPVGNCEDSDPVIDLIYWRDVKKTAVVFSSILLILFPLICYSVLTVLAYAALSVLVVTVGIRLYRLVLQTLNGTQQPHPFQEYLDVDLSLSPENAQKYANVISVNVNRYVGNARDLLMVKNTLSSLKFGVFLWLLTYVGALFNGLTFLIIDVIILFTVPPVYEKYQAQIDGYCGLAKDKVNAVVSGIKEKIPGKKEKTQ